MTSHDYVLKVHMTVGWSSLPEVFTMLRLIAINIVNAEITVSNLPCDLRLVTKSKKGSLDFKDESLSRQVTTLPSLVPADVLQVKI